MCVVGRLCWWLKNVIFSHCTILVLTIIMKLTKIKTLIQKYVFTLKLRWESYRLKFECTSMAVSLVASLDTAAQDLFTKNTKKVYVLIHFQFELKLEYKSESKTNSNYNQVTDFCSNWLM